ncbi:hypothetical protein [Polaribacter sp. IC073]|uniref:hypothetical protein n=1 Tax=Polaribacter sp. IC073 TaxID=2508540 RepID=UPI0011BF92E3|nr:hypothetical protein [Polaribacter sp. IC073]TXD47331.1 hypothetical protein ES045_12090 [Polaribacter sp. IC073]
MIIDNVNIATVYLATLLQGGLEAVLQYPKIKKPVSNDWAEHDGLEVDLSSPKLDSKGIDLNLLIDETKIDLFITFLLAKTYRVYHFSKLNTSFKLRFSGISDIEKIQGKCFIKLKLENDAPLKDYVYSVPNLTASSYNYTVDNVDISTYGIVPLQGSKDGLEGALNTKDKLEIKSNYTSGVKVAEQISKKQENKAILNLFMNQSTANFLKGYNAFLYNLIQPNARVLVANGKTYNFYYESSKISDLVVSEGKVWCKFSLNIVTI